MNWTLTDKNQVIIIIHNVITFSSFNLKWKGNKVLRQESEKQVLDGWNEGRNKERNEMNEGRRKEVQSWSRVISSNIKQQSDC